MDKFSTSSPVVFPAIVPDSVSSALFTATLDAMIIADDEGRYVEANLAACNLFGIPKTELLGRTVADFSELDFDFRAAWQAFLEAGQGQGEFYLKRLDGEVRIVQFSANANFIPHFHLSILRDITESKRLEIALWESETRYFNLIQSIEGVVWEYNPQEHKFTFISDKIESFLGYPKEYWLTESDFWEHCIHADDQKWVLDYSVECVKNKKNYTLDYRLITKDNKIVWVNETVTIVEETSGQVNLRGLMVDITKRKEMELALERFNKELETKVEERTAEIAAQMIELKRLSLLKDNFLSTISHELRTPLNNMNMAITMLKRDSRSDRRDFYLQALEQECKREKELINDLLDLQRLESSESNLNLEEILIREWLPTLIESFSTPNQGLNYTLSLDIKPNVHIITSDRMALERILVELVNNACKYTFVEEGLVHVTAQSIQEGFQVIVKNNGPAIPPEALPFIFNKFYRVPSSDPWKRGGTGLGLALVKQLVEKLKGWIEVISEGEETIFTLTLPKSK